MLLAFLKARVGHLSVMAATRGAGGGATAQREADLAGDLEQKLQVYSLGMSETTDILNYITEYAATASEPRVSVDTLDRIAHMVLAHGKAELASAAPASGEAGDKQKHAHGEAYLVASEWEALRDIKVSVPNKVHERMHAPACRHSLASLIHLPC